MRLVLQARWGSRRATIAAWAVATLAALVGLQGAPGISRDEATVLAGAVRSAGERRPDPPLPAAVASAVHAVGASAGISHLRASRLGSALAGALLSALLAGAAWALAGPAAAALAPALFWLSPRTLHAGLVATPEVWLAALSLAAVVAWRRSVFAEGRGGRAGWAIASGALVGAAVLSRADAWVLVLALAAHAAAMGVLRLRPWSEPARRGALAGLAVALAAGAVVVVVAWPGVLRSGTEPWLPPPGAAAAPALALLAIPAPLLCAFAGGLAHAGVRIARAVRERSRLDRAVDDALLVLASLAALGGAALAHAPAGARPFLHALPFLALLGARALLRASELAWPWRCRPLAAALSLLVLYPGLRSAVAAFPDGAAAWNELAGGAPGAASRGLRRQDGGEAVAALIGQLNARAAPGSRIWWPGVAPGAVEIYARDGRVRGDLTTAAGPADADLAVVPLDGGSRDAEYRAWAALRTARPSAGVYAAEVPLAFVYARPGAWR